MLQRESERTRGCELSQGALVYYEKEDGFKLTQQVGSAMILRTAVMHSK